MAPSPALGLGAASADSGGHVQAAFTKWAIGDVNPLDGDGDLTDMVGVVGGQAGDGTFFGEVFSYADNGTTTTIHAVYHINGSKESLVADNTVTVNDATGIADITGFVRGGSLNGAEVDGTFRTKSPCPIPTPGNVNGTVCYSGTLNITG
jgi:hypothetical protein